MKILFVCTGNTCRSPMAEYMLRYELARRGVEGVSVRSAGLCAMEGAPVSFGTLNELMRRGMDASGARATLIKPEMAKDAWVLTMTHAQAEALKDIPGALGVDTVTGYAGLPGEMTDPYGLGDIAYRRTAERMEQAVSLIADRIEREAKNK